MTIVSSIILIVGLIPAAYFDPNMNFSLLNIAFWSICTFISIFNFYSTLIALNIIWYLSITISIIYHNTNEEDICFEKFEKFMTKHYIMISPTFDDYVKGNRHSKRLIIIIIMKIISLLMIFKYIISAIINNPWIWSLLSDGNYIIGNQRILTYR